MLRLKFALSSIALVTAAFLSTACASPDVKVDEAADEVVSSEGLSAAKERSLAQRLPTSPDLDAWYQEVEEMETALANGDARFVFEPHRGGGTSAYVEVKRDGKTIGAFLPKNDATIPLGEVRAFQLARALGAPSNVGRGVFLRLRGAGLGHLYTIMDTESYPAPNQQPKESNRRKVVAELTKIAGPLDLAPGATKEEKRQKIVAKLAATPASLLGVYKDWGGPKPKDYESLGRFGRDKDEKKKWGNGLINEQDPFVKLLASSAPRAGTNAVALLGGKAPQIDLAKQLSTLLLIDALNGQWDRFSGGNMHALVENGVVRFATLDNGGVSPSGTGLAATYRDAIIKNWVTRYDREVATRIVAMNALVAGAAPEALGFRNAEALRDALMMSPDGEWPAFKTGLAAVAGALAKATTDESYF